MEAGCPGYGDVCKVDTPVKTCEDFDFWDPLAFYAYGDQAKSIQSDGHVCCYTPVSEAGKIGGDKPVREHHDGWTSGDTTCIDYKPVNQPNSNCLVDATFWSAGNNYSYGEWVQIDQCCYTPATGDIVNSQVRPGTDNLWITPMCGCPGANYP